MNSLEKFLAKIRTYCIGKINTQGYDEKHKQDIYAYLEKLIEDLKERINNLNEPTIPALDENQTKILREYLVGDEGKTKSCKDIGNENGISRQAISRRIISYCEKIKNFFINEIDEYGFKLKYPNKHPLETIKEYLAISAYNRLKSIGIDTIEQLTEMSPEQIENIKGIGKKGLESVIIALHYHYGIILCPYKQTNPICQTTGQSAKHLRSNYGKTIENIMELREEIREKQDELMRLTQLAERYRILLANRLNGDINGTIK